MVHACFSGTAKAALKALKKADCMNKKVTIHAACQDDEFAIYQTRGSLFPRILDAYFQKDKDYCTEMERITPLVAKDERFQNVCFKNPARKFSQNPCSGMRDFGDDE